MTAKPRIPELGSRHGLQVENTSLPLAEKILEIEKVLASGVDIVQLGTFANPGKLP